MASERADQPVAPWHALPADEALTRLESSAEGLAEAEAERRRGRYGPNRLRIVAAVPAWRLLADQLRSVVVALLAVAAVVALAVGQIPDAAAIAAVLAINVGLGFWTELGARRAMEGLRRLQVQEAVVKRPEGDRAIDAAELVPGDVIVLEAGGGIPADGRLLEAGELRIIEAPLTGEPFPAEKSPAAVAEPEPLPARTSMVYKGTLVATGRGLAVVTATGPATEVGRISELVQETTSERTPLEDRLDRLGRRLVGLTLGVAAAVTGIGILRGGSTWLMVETGLALAIAAVPEGLPVVATITLAVGMHRMARRRALVRRLPAVEALGSTTVICTDKTGTLTAGEMTVTAFHLAGRRVAVTGTGLEPRGGFAVAGRPRSADQIPGLRLTLEAGVLANRAALHAEGGARRVRGDPTEAALLVAAEKAGIGREELLRRLPEVSEVPFSSDTMLMATFHRRSDGGLVAQVKGAPGLLIERATSVWTADGPRLLEEPGREELRAANRRLAAEGLRVLALASKALAPAEEPSEAALHGLTFLALVAISDPPAPGVAEAIRSFHGAGVRTVMLTGDQRITAEAVALELGILRPGDRVLDGRELSALGDEELAAGLDRAAAFSRVSPADKVRIVAGLRRRGEIVAMLGDGVNDAPALRHADIGLAMGGRGADLAKETADIVLVDDRFETIAAAVEEGRVIFDNIRKFIFYLFSCNLSEVLVLFTSVVAGLPLPLLPLQILWLNLVTDVFPALALAMEPAEPDVMRRPPRDPDAAILSRRFLLLTGSYSVLLAGLAIAIFSWAVWVAEMELERARTLAFMTLALTQLAHVFNARSPRPVLFSRRLFQNRWVWGAIALTAGMQLAVVYVPPLARLLGTRPLAASDWLLVAACSAVTLVLGQLVKARPRRRAGKAIEP
ncbi:MAG TPA: cation-transporting P-type ATPase [Thermoanaerobaculia bacterium]|nr:cation-transporting P-type ATPase [Thermoanaerobaculia bacterium]